MAILSKLDSPVQEVPAVDTLDTVVDRNTLPKIQQAYEKVQEDVTRTAGLEKTLNLCLGAKAILKKNKDVEAGLVNGSIGTVVGLKIKKQTVQAVEVNFHRIDKKVKIQRESCSFEVLHGIYYTRKHCPLMLSFAITVHKSQGLSLSCAIVDAGSSCFGTGMLYVALSRVTTLSGLHLLTVSITASCRAIAKQWHSTTDCVVCTLHTLTSCQMSLNNASSTTCNTRVTAKARG